MLRANGAIGVRSGPEREHDHHRLAESAPAHVIILDVLHAARASNTDGYDNEKVTGGPDDIQPGKYAHRHHD